TTRRQAPISAMTANGIPVRKNGLSLPTARAMQSSASPFFYTVYVEHRALRRAAACIAGIKYRAPYKCGIVRHLLSAFNVSQIDPRRDSLVSPHDGRLSVEDVARKVRTFRCCRSVSFSELGWRYSLSSARPR